MSQMKYQGNWRHQSKASWLYFGSRKTNIYVLTFNGIKYCYAGLKQLASGLNDEATMAANAEFTRRMNSAGIDMYFQKFPALTPKQLSIMKNGQEEAAS